MEEKKDAEENIKSKNFIEEFVEEDIKEGKNSGRIQK